MSSYQFSESFASSSSANPLNITENKSRSIHSVGGTQYLATGASATYSKNANASVASAIASTSASFAATRSKNEAVSRIAQDLLELQRSTTNKTIRTNQQSSGAYLSDVEAAILRSVDPIELNESEEITVNGQRGIWANKSEVINWRGIIPLSQYLINEDSNPEIITKKSQQQLEYVQELAIRYLRPPTPPAPGEIVITQEVNTLTPPAPPLVIRQQPPRPETPEPLVIREAPPQPPAQVGRKVITISGKRLPPPPRKVVIERLAPLPSKPQSVIIERWLPYSEVKRRVIFQKSNEQDPVVVKPRNIIVQWEAPEVQIKKEYKYLGVIRANPVEYVQRFGSTLKVASELPDFVLDIKTPDGLVLAANYQYNSLHELEGDLQALKLIDLDKEGLGAYRSYLQRLGILESSSSTLTVNASSRRSTEELIEQLFKLIDRNNNGRINVEDAEKILLRLNSRLGRRYGEDDVRAFFNALDANNDGSLDLQEFKTAFLNLAI